MYVQFCPGNEHFPGIPNEIRARSFLLLLHQAISNWMEESGDINYQEAWLAFLIIER